MNMKRFVVAVLALCLVLAHDVKTECAEVDLMRVSDLFDVSHTLRVDVLLGASREAVDECEIALLDTLCRDMEIFLRLVWDVVL